MNVVGLPIVLASPLSFTNEKGEYQMIDKIKLQDMDRIQLWKKITIHLSL